ncbi:MAG: hypothetical protein ABIT83_07335 [Massilia sp.]
MNTLTAPVPYIALPRRNRLLAGIVVSVLAHLALMWLYRPGVHRFAIEDAPARPITVRLRAPEPVVPPAITSEPALKPKARPRASTPPRPTIVVPPAANEPAETVAVTPSEITAPAEVPPKQPAFDIDKARQQARKLANAPDPAKADTPLARLQQRELEEKTKAAKAMEGAHRPYCKDGLPGGLLGPIFLLFDKKDSGCRW